VLLALGVGIGLGYVLTRDDSKASTTTTPATGVVTVPDVVGQRADRAASRLVDSGGRANVTTTTGDTPGSPVPAKVQIPDVVGMTLADVRASLAKAGLKTDPMEVASTQPKSTVGAVPRCRRPGEARRVRPRECVAGAWHQGRP
jgi:hypothetical protein